MGTRGQRGINRDSLLSTSLVLSIVGLVILFGITCIWHFQSSLDVLQAQLYYQRELVLHFRDHISTERDVNQDGGYEAEQGWLQPEYRSSPDPLDVSQDDGYEAVQGWSQSECRSSPDPPNERSNGERKSGLYSTPKGGSEQSGLSGPIELEGTKENPDTLVPQGVKVNPEQKLFGPAVPKGDQGETGVKGDSGPPKMQRPKGDQVEVEAKEDSEPPELQQHKGDQEEDGVKGDSGSPELQRPNRDQGEAEAKRYSGLPEIQRPMGDQEEAEARDSGPPKVHKPKGDQGEDGATGDPKPPKLQRSKGDQGEDGTGPPKLQRPKGDQSKVELNGVEAGLKDSSDTVEHD